MRVCINCGNRIHEDFKFCLVCGVFLTEVKAKCPECEKLHAELEAAKAENAVLKADYASLEKKYFEMYAGRECPKCGYHVTMNIAEAEKEVTEQTQEGNYNKKGAERCQVKTEKDRKVMDREMDAGEVRAGGPVLGQDPRKEGKRELVD